MEVSLLLFVCALTVGSPFDEALVAADALAAQARAVPAEDKTKGAAVQCALDAYGALLREKGKDPKLGPRLRRRRASLLKHAGRSVDALAEYDAIVNGRARRKDRARALVDGGKLLERSLDHVGAAARYRRAAEDYRDIVRVRAEATVRWGRMLEMFAKPKGAARCYRLVIDKCGDQAEWVIASYDALALMAVRASEPGRARRWLSRCVARFEKRAARGDKYGAFVARLLGAMKAPAALAAAGAKGGQKRSGHRR